MSGISTIITNKKIDIADDNFGAMLSEAKRNGAADSITATGNHRYLVG